MQHISEAVSETSESEKMEYLGTGKINYCFDLTVLLSPVSSLAWFCALPEVKIPSFKRLKDTEGKLL